MALEDLYARACEAVERGNYGYTIELLRVVLRQQPDYPDARAMLRGTERRRLQNEGGALVAMLTAPFAAGLTVIKATISKPLKRLEAYEDYLERRPNSFWALRNAAAAAAKAGYKDDAALMYRDALKLKPKNRGCLRALTDLLVSMDERREAAGYLARLVQMKPNDRDLLGELRDLQATEHMAAHKMDEAESFRDLIRDKDQAEEFEKGRRGVVTKDDQRTQAERMAAELAEHPDNVNRILALADLYVSAEQFEKAEQLLKEKVQVVPDSYDVRAKLGDVQLAAFDRKIRAAQQGPGAEEKVAALRKARAERAVQEYTWRLDAHPTDNSLRMRLGEAYYGTGDYNKAIGVLQLAGQDIRVADAATRLLGLCFMRKGQYDLALEQFDQAVAHHDQLDDQGKELRYLQAQAYEGMGDVDNALSIYKHLYSRDINFRDVADKVDALTGTGPAS